MTDPCNKASTRIVGVNRHVPFNSAAKVDHIICKTGGGKHNSENEPSPVTVHTGRPSSKQK